MFTLTSQDRHGVAIEPIEIVDPQGRIKKRLFRKNLFIRSEANHMETSQMY